MGRSEVVFATAFVVLRSASPGALGVCGRETAGNGFILILSATAELLSVT